jgi:oligopeptide transport system permease protein
LAPEISIRAKRLPPAIEKNIREKYGLDKPWYQQYGKTMWNIVRHGDFGTSLKYEGQSVNTIIARSLPVSAAVGITCLHTVAHRRHHYWIYRGA